MAGSRLIHIDYVRWIPLYMSFGTVGLSARDGVSRVWGSSGGVNIQGKETGCDTIDNIYLLW